MRGILLRPLLLCELLIANLIVAPHRPEQPASHGAYRRSSSCISSDRAANRANPCTPRRSPQGSSSWRLLCRWRGYRPWPRGWIEAGLIGRPGAAFPCIPLLLLGALTSGRIDEQVISQRPDGRSRDSQQQGAHCNRDFLRHAEFSRLKMRPDLPRDTCRLWSAIEFWKPPISTFAPAPTPTAALAVLLRGPFRFYADRGLPAVGGRNAIAALKIPDVQRSPV
jgi:hypothetical protein